MPFLPLLLLTSLPAPRSEGGDVVSLVRENYVAYEDARWGIAPDDLARAEVASSGGEAEAVEAYLRLWGDPRLKSLEPISGKIRAGSFPGPNIFNIEPPPPFVVSPVHPTVLLKGEVAKLDAIRREGRSVIFDLRAKLYGEDWTIASTVASLPFVLTRRSATLAGEEMRATPAIVRLYRDRIFTLPQNGGAYERLKAAKPGGLVTIVPARELPLEPQAGLKRIALLVDATTNAEGIRFATLAREDLRVRVFGSPTGPPTLREQEFNGGVDRWRIQIPTARLIGIGLVMPDEDVRSLSLETRRAFGDAAFVRADQWCRLGQ